MTNKIKVVNDNNFNIGIRFENEINREITIRAKSFSLLEEDDILYINSVSKLIKNGKLKIESEELMQKMGYTEKIPDSITEEEIVKLFKLTNAKLKNELEKITSKHAIDKVIDLAKNSDLTQTKLKVINDVFGIDIFEEISNDVI